MEFDMKKIAFVVPWYGDNIPGGAEAALRGITDHLYDAGVDIEILTTTVEKFASDWNKNFYKPGQYRSKRGILIRRFNIRKRNTEIFDAINLKLMRNNALTLEEENIFQKEMVNSPDLYAYIRENRSEYSFFVFIPYMFGTTYWGVQECLEQAVLIPCFHDENYVYMKTFREVYSKVAGMLFNAQPEEELTRKVYDIANVKTEVMGLGLDVDLTYDAERFRRKYQITDPFILYAGRKDKGKNIDTLITYFKRYKETQKDHLKLVLIGGGELNIPAEIKADIYDLGFVDLQDKYDAYGAAALLCQPSKNESFSFVIMESWLCNRPVLVHEGCPVTKNFVKTCNGGLYFNSYYEFQETVKYILKHPDIADQMAKNGHDYVCDNFAWDVIVKKYQNFFKELEERNA